MVRERDQVQQRFSVRSAVVGQFPTNLECDGYDDDQRCPGYLRKINHIGCLWVMGVLLLLLHPQEGGSN